MANLRTLTSADVVLTLVVAGLFDTPTQIQGFTADNVIATEGPVTAETSIGVDGRLSAGFVHNKVPQKIYLQADSESVDFFDTIYRAQQSQQTVFFCSGEITVKATGKSYTMTRGVMVKGKPIPDIKKILSAPEYDFEWESVSPKPA